MDLKDGKEKSKTGTTTVSYVDAMVMAIAPIKSTSFVVKNTHISATMYFKALIYRNIAGTLSEEYQEETELAAGAQDEVNIDRTPHTKAVLQVKYNSGAGTYSVEGVQYRRN